MTFGPGSYIYSKSRYRADDDITPVGGVVIDVRDPQVDVPGSYRVVGCWRGQIEYFDIDSDDADTGMSEGAVQVRILKDVLLKLGEDEARHRDPLRHLTAPALCWPVFSSATRPRERADDDVKRIRGI